MKIVVLGGVGFHPNSVGNKLPLVQNIRRHFPQHTVEYYNWLHQDIPVPDIPKDDVYNKIVYPLRKFMYEVILDFDAVIAHPFDIEIPEADLYLGHSAGSVLALTRSVQAITFGSPFTLVKDLQTMKNSLGTSTVFNAVTKGLNPILNIVNTHDILALKIEGVDNYTYTATWNPILAHQDYWTNPVVSKVIIDKIETLK